MDDADRARRGGDKGKGRKGDEADRAIEGGKNKMKEGKTGEV